MRKILNSELNRLSTEEYHDSSKTPIYILLDNIRSAQNVGSFFRTADAFRCEKLMLCGITARPPHKEIEKTALGATNTVNWKHYPTTLEAIEELKREGIQVFGVEQITGSISLEQWKVEGNSIALVFGSEVGGISDEVVNQLDGAIEIPMIGTKHSLNVSVSGGMVMWEAFKQLK